MTVYSRHGEVMSASPNSMSILDLITTESMVVPLVAGDKQEAIDSLVDHMGSTSKLEDVEELKHLVWTRENQRSTGIGNGLAIPHGKSDSISKLVLVIGVLAEPIEFDSVDGKPVKMIALLLSPSDKIAEHIQALGKISRLMNDEDFRDNAYGCQSSKELFDLIKTASE